MSVRLRFGHRTDFGCTIEQSRYLPWCVAPDRVLVVAPELVRLLWGLGVALVPATPEDDALPLIGVPAPPGVGLPRLWEDPVASSDLARLPRPRVGLCWRGSGAGNQGVLPDGSDSRDVPAALLRPVVEELQGITWIGLQLADHAHELPIHGLDTFRVHDFAETAGIIRQLDLVISVDTAVAHLAANLGAPTWVLSPATDAIKRWPGFTAGPGPFYPSVRVLQQSVPGEWAPLISEIRTALDADPDVLATVQRWAEQEGGGEWKVRARVRDARLAAQGRNIGKGPWDSR